MDTTWKRDHDGWRRSDWLVRQTLGSTGQHPQWWELCKPGGDDVLRVLSGGPTARGMMDQADISDGIA